MSIWKSKQHVKELLIAVLLCVFAGFGKQQDLKESSPLLILLVTCLVICLLIVVIFFVIRLRRAHIAWKKGNIRLFICLYFTSSFNSILEFGWDLILDSILICCYNREWRIRPVCGKQQIKIQSSWRKAGPGKEKTRYNCLNHLIL